MPSVVLAYPSARYIFLTLTIRNCRIEELRETIELMSVAWRRLTQRKQFPAIGFVRSLEVTRNLKDGSAHPHFHCLLMVPAGYFTDRHYLSQKVWTELWQSCLKVDYVPIVNVKAVKSKEGADSLIKALCETLKYSVKESDLVSDRQWFKEITKQMHKVRAISIGGVFKQYLSEDDPEDLIHSSQEAEDKLKDAPKLIFDWSQIIKKYIKRTD
jgi:plasmid rolling circle replication initiator protein Rep